MLSSDHKTSKGTLWFVNVDDSIQEIIVIKNNNPITTVFVKNKAAVLWRFYMQCKSIISSNLVAVQLYDF